MRPFVGCVVVRWVADRRDGSHTRPHRWDRSDDAVGRIRSGDFFVPLRRVAPIRSFRVMRVAVGRVTVRLGAGRTVALRRSPLCPASHWDTSHASGFDRLAAISPTPPFGFAPGPTTRYPTGEVPFTTSSTRENPTPPLRSAFRRIASRPCASVPIEPAARPSATRRSARAGSEKGSPGFDPATLGLPV